MNIFFTADVHLKNYGDEKWEALNEVCETANKNNCEHLIIGGDLFDDISTVRELGQKMGDEIFDNFDFTVHIIPGNHDFEAFTGKQYFGKNVNIYLEYSYLDINDRTRIHFIPYKSEKNYLNKMLFNVKKNNSEKNIVILHTNLNTIFYSDEEKNYQYMESELSDYKGYGINLVLAGHIHSKMQHWGFEGGEFYYAGSPVSITKKEIGKRYTLLITIEDKINIEEIPLDTFYYEELNYFFNMNDEEILKKIKGNISKIDDKVHLILNISGFIKGSEYEIRDQIKLPEKLKMNAVIRFNINELSRLNEDPIFKDFKKKIDNDQKLQDEERLFILQEFIGAMENGGRK
jgi:DNA repair exonuclease SbcCD nuclease subunit